MPVDFAEIILQTLLDPTRYDPTWVSEEEPTRNEQFPHVDAFCEYITQSEPRPVHVINKDQFEQFYEFNLAVSWSAVEHSEDSACKFFSWVTSWFYATRVRVSSEGGIRVRVSEGE
jgi:hypothetical protein